ncbi:MAG: AAA family ATPase, partial [Catalinimonas sp.]
AHPDVFNILLQVLDDGRLTDNKGRVANFKNTIIIMTSNLGSHLIQAGFDRMRDVLPEGADLTDAMGDTRDEVMELLRQSLRPEFLNRIDEIVMFQPLSRKELRRIVELQFRQIQQRLAESGIRLEATDDVFDKLGELGYDPQFGARPLKRIMQRMLLNELSKEILSGRITKDAGGGPAVVGITLDGDGKLAFMNVDRVEL